MDTNENIIEFSFGALDPQVDIRDYQYVPDMMSLETEDDLPKSFKLDIRPDIKNQGSVGSCVAHTSAEIAEYYNKKQQNSDEKMSVGYIYGCRYSYKGSGMYLRDALKTLKNNGIALHSEFPYNREVPEIIDLFKAVKEWKTDTPNKISTYFSISTINRNYKIKKALLDYGPVMVSIKWFKDFKVKNGIITSSLDGEYGGHCVMLYGWNENGWLIQNSWGKGWGIKGTATYPYEFPFKEVWGITDTIVNKNDIKIKKDTKFWNTVYKFINGLINLIKKYYIK